MDETVWKWLLDRANKYLFNSEVWVAAHSFVIPARAHGRQLNVE
jgi:hypothetical protein